MLTQLSLRDIEKLLINITQSFLIELNRQRQAQNVTLQSRLDQELGIDSLGRVELFHRIESALNVELPEKLMIEVQTLEQLALGIISSNIQAHVTRTVVEHTHEKPKASPEQVHSLTELLIQRAKLESDRLHIILQDDSGEEKKITYGDLYQNAKQFALNLQSLGIEPGDTVAIMLPTCEDFFYCFMGILLCGAIAVPIYPPLSIHKIEEYAIREAQILRNAEARLLITFDKAERLSEILKVFIPSMKAVLTTEDLRAIKATKQRYEFNQADMPAMIQYTSGSTSTPKGVLLSHQKLLANIRAAGQAIGMNNHDCGVSWLPLYHDMGLIGAWFSPFYQGFPVVIMSPLTFLARPERWLWAMHYHRATLSAAPNFAFELCCRRIKEENIKGLDLSAMRLLFNGAEKVNPKTIARFTEKFAPYGFKPQMMFPVYGLAESVVALCFPKLNHPPKIDSIDRVTFEQRQIATPSQNTAQAIEFVSCGVPVPGHEIRVVDSHHQVVADRHVGFLHFRGPSTMLGYYRQPEATEAITYDDWIDTGDLAYIADGELYITGRKKDLIIKAGRNIYPEEIEEVAGQVDGVRKGCVIAFGVEDISTATERLIIVAEVKDQSKSVKQKIIAEVNEKCGTVLGFTPDEVVLVPPKTVPKTSSGKLQRSHCKQSYLDGQLTKRKAVWLQYIKLFTKSTLLRSWNTLKQLFKVIYTIYVGIFLLLSIPLIYILTYFTTYRGFARILKYWTKMGLWIVGCPVCVKGQIPLNQNIFVANHASYIDSVVLVSQLPIGTKFVAKKELMATPFLGRVLKKYQILTVDRVDFLNSLTDLQEINKVLSAGSSLAIFPEGTFTYATGLRAFKMGAFKVAAQSNIPICPIALAGTRDILRGDQRLLAPGRIQVTVGETIHAQNKEWNAVLSLHEEARRHIAKFCGELTIEF